MKLKDLTDLLQEKKIFIANGISFSDFSLNFEQLALLRSELLACDEFKDVEELIILQSLITSNTEGKPLVTQTLRITDGIKFQGKVYLYGLSLSPEIFDPMVAYSPVKDGLGLSPTLYNPINFTPEKRIILTYTPEQAQDSIIQNDEEFKRNIHKLLDKVLDNPEEYQVHGDRYIMIRGLFETIVSPEGDVKEYNIGTVKLDYNNPDYYMAFYIKPQKSVDNKTIGLKISHKFIPASLKEKYLLMFENKGLNITEKELDDFLNENK
jgi:hypothetical protein